MDFGKLLYCRAKDAKTGAWVTGYYYEQPVMGCIGPAPAPLSFIIARDPNAVADWNMPVPVKHVLVDPKTVGLHTGVTVADDLPLFTDDFVQSGCFLGRVTIFQYPTGQWLPCILWYKGKKLVGRQFLADAGYNFDKLQLVGNIWDKIYTNTNRETEK